MSISLEEIVVMAVKEVVLELNKRGIQIDGEKNDISFGDRTHKKIRIDLSKYKTPLLTEAHILELDSKIEEIEIPVNTIITPSAQDLIRKRKILLTKK